VALVFVLGFVFWLSVPFIPDPVVLLFKKPTSDLTSASLPGQWSSVAWDLGGTRNIKDFSRQPKGQILWSKNLGNHTYGAPIVVDGIIYAGGDFKALALEAQTGETIWEIPTPGRMNHSFAVSDSYLYMGLSDHRLLALDRRTGDTRWEFFAKFPITSSPIVAGGMVFFGSSDRFVYSVDAATGNLIWKHRLNGNLRSSPAISGGYLYATDSDGNLNILNARTGQTRFRFRTAASASDAPTVENGLAYFPSGGRLFAVDAQARTVWGEFEFKKVWSQFYIWQFPGVPRPPSQRGERWRFAPEKSASRGIAASPAVAPEALYYGDTAGYVYAREVSTREELWRFRSEDGIVSSPVILGGRLYFGAEDGFFYALDRSNGKLLWRLSLGAPIEVSPVFAQGRFYVRTSDGRLHAIE
jgi:outer membrane protein assembly factor BamB